MPAAEEHQVGERGLAAVRPVLDVMGVHETPLGASRKAAAAVAAVQGPPQSGWDSARLASHGERPPATLGDPDHGRVAGNPARGLRRKRRPVLETRMAVHGVFSQGLVDVNHKLVTIPTRAPGLA